MSGLLGIAATAVLFAVFGLFWRDPGRRHQPPHDPPERDPSRCDTCPLAKAPPRARRFTIVR